MIRYSYDLRCDGTLQHLNVPFLAAGIQVRNNTAATITVTDVRGRQYPVPAGATQNFDIVPGSTQFNYQSSIAITTPNATMEVSDEYFPPLNTPTAQPPGTLPVSIQNATLTVTGTMTVTGTVAISNSNVNVTVQNSNLNATIQNASLAITNIPGGVLTIIQADVIAQFASLNNSSVAIVTTRRTGRISVQPVIGTLVRGGLLSVTATDPTTRTHEFLESVGFTAVLPPRNKLIPWVFDYDLPSGTTITVLFTGAMGLIVGY